MLSGEGAARILRSGDERAVATFYAESWALVHFLIMNGRGAGEAQVRAYLEDVAHGMPIGQAFQSAFGVTTEDAARRLAAYVRETGFPNLRLPPQPDAVATDVSVTPMTEAEAEYIQDDLLLRLGAEEEAGRQLRQALALDPSSSATKVALAILLITPDHAQEAIDALRPIADAEPRNLLAHLELAGAYRTAERYQDALAEYSRAAAINDQATAPWLGRAYSALALERYDESDKAMDHLMALDPEPGWYQSRAYQAFVLGNFAAAARDAWTYIDKAGRGAESAPYVAFLGAICQRRIGYPAEADALLADVRPELVPGSWGFKLMDFMRGTLGATTLLGSARDEDQRTEAHAYVGFALLQEGHLNEALESSCAG